MKERKLKFSERNETPAELSEETKKKLLENFKLAGSFLSVHSALMQKNKLTVDDVNTLCASLETCTVNICQLYDYESELAKEYEERYVRIRELNIENRELRRQLGEKCSAEDVRECVKTIEAKLRATVKTLFDGHTHEVICDGYGVKFHFSGMFGFCGTKKKYAEILSDKGFKIKGGHFKNTPENLDLITQEMQKHYPSFRIRTVEAYHGKEQIKDMFCDISNYDDFFADKSLSSTTENTENAEKIS